MHPEGESRLLDHLTLALAGVCLVWAEHPFLPQLQALVWLWLGLVALAWGLAGRWALPVWGANVLAALIALSAGLAGWWATMRPLGPGVRWIQEVPLPAALVPYLGPVLMALLLVQLFRPRRAEDFWLSQGLGLLQVALGCVLATGPVFGVLLLAYLVCGLGSVIAHYPAGERGSAPAAPAGPLPGRAPPRLPLRWAAAVAALAVPLYLLTPRGETPEWDPFHHFGVSPRGPARGQTGYREEMDLTRSGALEVDDAEAFTVLATGPAGRAWDGLAADQRWRGVPLDRYQDGVWNCDLRVPGGKSRGPEGPAPEGEAYALTFTVQSRRAGGLFLADPVRLGKRPGALPVVAEPPPGPDHPPLFSLNEGTVLPLLVPMWHEYRYRQTFWPEQPRDRYPAEGVSQHYREVLQAQRLPGLAEWTAGLLRRLAGEPRYGPFKVELVPGVPGDRPELLPKYWEATALLLTEYLARSGDYTYSLSLRREDLALDPVLDFLRNVKQGHCERYAAALALMLRSQGVPARVVKGFRGAEHQGDGLYAVRHSHAHAWVEALVPRRGGERGSLDWLVLDPTPATDAPPPPKFSLARWWQQSRRGGRELWHDLIVEYSASTQASLWEGLKSGQVWARALGLGLVLGVLALGVWAGRRLWRRRRPPGAAGFHARLLALLARHTGLRPGPAQTPREFAAAAGTALSALPAVAALAGLPARVTELFYRVRFGGQPLRAEEARVVARDLDALAAALRRRRGGA